MPLPALATLLLPAQPDHQAPDGSAIRTLPALPRGGLALCTLAPGRITQAVVHRTVEELWYCLAGQGRIWRQLGETAQIDELVAGVSLTIPTGTVFQFRAEGEAELQILIVTMPPWPGPDEAIAMPGPWDAERETS